MDSVTLTISRQDAECLMVVLDGQAERLLADDREAWDSLCNVTERLVGELGRCAKAEQIESLLAGMTSYAVFSAIRRGEKELGSDVEAALRILATNGHQASAMACAYFGLNQ